MVSLFLMPTGWAFVSDGGAGWANALYLAKILAENIKHYEQLKLLVEQIKGQEKYLKSLNDGIENSLGLLNSLPIKDEKILEEIKNYQSGLKSVQDIYGKVPRSGETALQLLHDQTVAESFKMVTAVKEYGEKQEENALKITKQSREASLKGATRMNAETNAQILHTLTQLLRINGQILKLQSEQLALNNKTGKDSIQGQIKTKNDLKKWQQNFKGDFNVPRF